MSSATDQLDEATAGRPYIAALEGLVDMHAHLADAAFDADRGEVLQRAREAGVTGVLTVGESLEDAEKILRLARENPAILPAAGLYPTRLDLDEAHAMVDFIRQHREELFAVGEVGLDYWKITDESERKLQADILTMMAETAIELDLPLNVHSRSAGRRTIEFLMELSARRVLMHAFDGKASTAEPAVRAGWFFSIPPSVERSRQKQKLVRALPLECLLLETDSPVLGADPAERNEPGNLRIPLNAIAEIKGTEVAAVSDAVRKNSERFFGLR